MTTLAADWQRINDLVLAALELEDAAREAFLDAECGDEVELRAEVDSLLGVDATVLDRLDRPALRLGAPTESHLAEDERLGPFRIRRELGRGGMGAVYLAVRDGDGKPETVAVKVLRSGVDLPRLFQREIDALRHLDHPAIVRLLDVGVDGERPYLVMEAVDGEPIDRFCAARHLDIPARLELFLRVLDAVGFAHRNRIVHRDLKPSNILVTAHGEPKLLDFGVAKFLESGTWTPRTVTSAGRRLLTLEYASPELLRGAPVSPSDDLYALGVLFYLLLTGRPPYRFETYQADELRRKICDEIPPPPSAVVEAPFPAGLEGALDRIAAAALAKDPAERYVSVDALALDLRQALDGAATVRRGRLARLAGIGLAVGIGLVLGAATWRGAAPPSHPPIPRTVTSTVDQVRAAESAVSTVLHVRGRAARRQGRPEEAVELLTEATARRRALYGDVHLEVAESLIELARAHLEAENAEFAEPLAAEGLAIRRQILGEGDARTARALVVVARAEFARGRAVDAVRHAEQALEVLRAILGAEHSDVVEAEKILKAARLLRGGPGSP